MTSPTERLLADQRQQAEAAEDQVRGRVLIARLFIARPDGRTLASVAEEEGWSPAEARRALAAARTTERAKQITYAPDGNRLRLVPTDEERRAAERRGEATS